jgi:hypothetical protein
MTLEAAKKEFLGPVPPEARQSPWLVVQKPLNPATLRAKTKPATATTKVNLPGKHAYA